MLRSWGQISTAMYFCHLSIHLLSLYKLQHYTQWLKHSIIPIHVYIVYIVCTAWLLIPYGTYNIYIKLFCMKEQ